MLQIACHACSFTPARTAVLAFGHDEEVGGQLGAGSMAKVLKERVSPASQAAAVGHRDVCLMSTLP